MNRIIIISIVLLMSSKESLSINSYNEGDTLFVWAPKGVYLRTDMSTYSDIIQLINYGDQVICMDSKNNIHYPRTESILEIDVNKNDRKDLQDFCLEGRWIKVKYIDKEGYIFDGYLSKLYPMKNNESFIDYAERTFKKVKVFTEKKMENCTIYQVVYENGVFIDQIDGCGEGYSSYRCYFLPFSLEEAYLIFYARFLSEYPMYYSYYKGELEGMYKFGFDLGELRIIKELNCVLVKETEGN